MEVGRDGDPKGDNVDCGGTPRRRYRLRCMRELDPKLCGVRWVVYYRKTKPRKKGALTER